MGIKINNMKFIKKNLKKTQSLIAHSMHNLSLIKKLDIQLNLGMNKLQKLIILL